MKKRHEGAVLPGMPEESVVEIPKEDNWIDEMVGALTDPLIVYKSPWMDDLPKWIGEQLPMARLVHLMKCTKGMAKWDECTDLEAMAYIYPRTLESPMTSDWVEIYCHLGYEVMYGQGLGLIKRENFPEDMKPTRDLTNYQKMQLRDLKRWIHRKKVQARKARRRGEKLKAETLEKEEKVSKAEEFERPVLFEF